jgi:hypothetical protein
VIVSYVEPKKRVEDAFSREALSSHDEKAATLFFGLPLDWFLRGLVAGVRLPP